MDIQNRADIELFVNRFYEKAFVDDLIGFIFVDVVKLNLEIHAPKIADFWETILFDVQKYNGNAMDKHFDINKIEPLKKEYFDRWILIFKQTIDELFVGDLAEKAKTRAFSIAKLMEHKMINHHNPKSLM